MPTLSLRAHPSLDPAARFGIRFGSSNVRLRVYLDDVDVSDECYECDIKLGMVWLWIRDSAGKFHRCQCGGVCTAIRYGRVRVVAELDGRFADEFKQVIEQKR